jgi:predicted transcriptional regulator of viral defense system
MAVLTPSTAGREGLSRSGLYRAVRDGHYDRIARGVYLSSDSPAADWDWLEAATRRADATICLTSALAQHDLTDAIPPALDVAVPRGARIPASGGSIAWHSFDRTTFALGRDETSIVGTESVIGLYSAERSIADAFRLRGAIGYEIARDALKEWLRRGGKPARLLEIAIRLPRAKGPVVQALDMLT